jgi:hypothetical protein
MATPAGAPTTDDIATATVTEDDGYPRRPSSREVCDRRLHGAEEGNDPNNGEAQHLFASHITAKSPQGVGDGAFHACS